MKILRVAAVSLLVIASGCAVAPAEESPESSTDSAFTAKAFSASTWGSGLFEFKGLAGMCLDFGPPPQVVGGPVFLYGCNGTIAQQIRVYETTDISTIVELRAGNKCIQPRGKVIANGTPLELANCDGSDAQHFERSGNELRMPTNGGLVIQVQGEQTANRTPLVIAYAAGHASQEWTITQLEVAGAPPLAPGVREDRYLVRDHRGGTTKDVWMQAVAYQDRSNTETATEVWVKSFVQGTYGQNDVRPWALLRSFPADTGTGFVQFYSPPMEAGRYYEYAVRAKNAYGYSPPSVLYIGALPPPPPVNPSTSGIGNTSLTLHWEEPQDSSRVDGYRIRYAGKLIDQRETSSVQWQEQVGISGLSSATSYCFQIATYNDFWGESQPVTTCAATLGGHPTGDQQTSISMMRQDTTQGYIPYYGSFGPISGGAVITKINSPTGWPAVLLLKPGHSTDDCGDPNAFVRVQGDMTAAQMTAVWGSATPTITGLGSLPFVGCSENTGSPTILNWLPINVTWHYHP